MNVVANYQKKNLTAVISYEILRILKPPMPSLFSDIEINNRQYWTLWETVCKTSQSLAINYKELIVPLCKANNGTIRLTKGQSYSHTENKDTQLLEKEVETGSYHPTKKDWERRRARTTPPTIDAVVMITYSYRCLVIINAHPTQHTHRCA
jgi:hypothetical protein